MSQPETATSTPSRRAMTGRRAIRMVKTPEALIRSSRVRGSRARGFQSWQFWQCWQCLALSSLHASHVRSKIGPAGVSGGAARAAAGTGAWPEEGVRAPGPAAGPAEDLQHARLPRGRAVCALRERTDGGDRVEPRWDVRSLRVGPAHLRAVRVLRYQRHLRVPASDPRADLAEGRQEHLWGVRAEDHGGAGDEVGRADERP